MAGLNEAEDLLPQNERESAEFLQALTHLDHRVSNLSVFEQAVFGTATEITAPPEALQIDEDLHKKIDLFTHFQSCSSRRRMSKFDRLLQATQKCRECYDCSTTMDFESWQPNDHHITIQRFEAMAKKEARARHMIQMGPAGPDGTRGSFAKIPRNRKPVYMSGRVNTKSETSPSPVLRTRVLRGGGARRRVLVHENSSDTDVSADDEGYEVRGVVQDSNDDFRGVGDETNKWNEDDDSSMDVLSADMAHG